MALNCVDRQKRLSYSTNAWKRDPEIVPREKETDVTSSSEKPTGATALAEGRK